MIGRGNMKLFAEEELSRHLEVFFANLKREVNEEDKNRLLNVSEDEYVEYLANKYSVGPIIFDEEGLSISNREEMIPSERFPRSTFHVTPGKSYPKQVISYHLPYTGNSRLLRMVPSQRILWSVDVVDRGADITFDVINWIDDPEEIKRQADETLKNILKQGQYSRTQVEAYNNSLSQQARQVVSARKQEHLKQSNLMESLGVPFKRKGDVPQTFTVPIKKKPINVMKPKTSNEPYKPEPTLDQATYTAVPMCFLA